MTNLSLLLCFNDKQQLLRSYNLPVLLTSLYASAILVMNNQFCHEQNKMPRNAVKI